MKEPQVSPSKRTKRESNENLLAKNECDEDLPSPARDPIDQLSDFAKVCRSPWTQQLRFWQSHLQHLYGMPFPADFFLLWKCAWSLARPLASQTLSDEDCLRIGRAALLSLVSTDIPLRLCGPYDVLAGCYCPETKNLAPPVNAPENVSRAWNQVPVLAFTTADRLDLHCRLPWQSPEQMTLLISLADKKLELSPPPSTPSLMYLAYFRDNSRDMPKLVVCPSGALPVRVSSAKKGAVSPVVEGSLEALGGDLFSALALLSLISDCTFRPHVDVGTQNLTLSR
jgi:hypothetical protein